MNSRYRTPLKKVQGLGSAKAGTHHFFVQRLTAIALVFLACWFLYFVVGLMQADYLTATDAVDMEFLEKALAMRFGVNPRFVQVRLQRYGLIRPEAILR